MITLFESEDHKNIMFNDLSTGLMVQSNQHLIIHGNEGMILDPGGHKVYAKLFPEIATVMPVESLKFIFFSHQDPDIIAAANGWLMVTDAHAYLPEIWMRFIPHFGVDKFVVEKIQPIPDNGLVLSLSDVGFPIIPAHFLHSPGNFQVYDPVSKILYSGDLGASLGNDYHAVTDFDAHIQYMAPFHKRYIPTGKALKMWVNTIKSLDIEQIAPQHGAIFPDKETVGQFIDWVGQLACGLDLMDDGFAVPQ